MRALRVIDALGALLSLVGCLLVLAAWPSVALADNCSDPPRLQSNGTWSAPGPDCQATKGYQDGGKLAGNIVRGGAVAIFGTFATGFLVGKGQIKVMTRPDGSKVHVIVPGTPLDRFVRGDRSPKVMDAIRALHPKGVNVGVYRPSGTGPAHPGGPGRDGSPTTRHVTTRDGRDVLVLTPGTAIQVQIGAPPVAPPAGPTPPTPPTPAPPTPPAPTPPVISVPPAGPTTTTPPPAGGGPSGGPGGGPGGGLLPPGGPGDSSLTRPTPGTDGGAGTQPRPQPSNPAAGGGPATPADTPPKQPSGGGLLGVEGGPGGPAGPGGPGDSSLTRPAPGASAGPAGPSGPGGPAGSGGPGGAEAGGSGAGGPGTGAQGAAGPGSGGSEPPKAGASDSPPQLASDGRGGAAPTAQGDAPPATGGAGGDGPSQPGPGAASTTSSTTPTAPTSSTTSTSSTPSTTSAGGDTGGASTAGQDPSSGPPTSTSNTTSSATGQQPQPPITGEKAADLADNAADAVDNKNTNLKPAQPTQPSARPPAPPEPPVPPALRPLVTGGTVTVDPKEWAPGGVVKEELLKQVPDIQRARLDTRGGKVKVTITTEQLVPDLKTFGLTKKQIKATIELQVQGGKIVAKGEGGVGVIAAAKANQFFDGPGGPNEWLAKRGLTMDAFGSTPTGQIQITTSKVR